MRLRDIVGQMRTMAMEGSLDREIAGLSYDSRRITPGMLFVAMRGEHTDGHDHILEALERGAAAIVCERNGFIPQRATKVKVADARQALAEAAAAYYQFPSSKLKVIGVTGTNGKTTIAFMIRHILETAGTKTGLMGTVRYEVGERVIPAQRTTPEALELHHMMAQMVRAGCQACVMEVSSHALEQRRVHGIRFDAAIFTNLTQDHLDYHHTMEAYYQAKRKLFVSPQLGEGPGAAIINSDDSYGRRLAGETQAEVVLSYGFGQEAKLRATRIQLGRDSTQMDVLTPQGDFSCRLPLIGRHNVYNALAALGTGLALKVDLNAIRKALESIPAVPGRLETVEAQGEFRVFVDYAHTDDALRNVLITLREITPGRILLAFGCGGNRDKEKRGKMGRVAAELADFTCITSDNPRRESAADIAAEIETGFRAVRRDGYKVQLDRKRAIEEVVRMAESGDTVLLAGKGHEAYQEFADTVVPFDDRDYAREALETATKSGKAI